VANSRSHEKSGIPNINQSAKEIKMIASKLLSTSVLVVMLTAAHSASATIRKCASDACADDAKIVSSVEALLDSHAEFGPPKTIRVQSFDHVVYLYGLVDTGMERSTAGAVASLAPGVARVVNSIDERN
jgi:osmotically-inducible protein OsmY